MSDFNFDEKTVNKLKNMINNGELNDVISGISPEMIENISSVINNGNNTNNTESNNSKNSSENNFNNIDINTIIKMKSIIDKMNSNNDPRSNLLNSLKPYLRDSRKQKIDQYANLINFTKIAELLKTDNKENPNA